MSEIRLGPQEADYEEMAERAEKAADEIIAEAEFLKVFPTFGWGDKPELSEGTLARDAFMAGRASVQSKVVNREKGGETTIDDYWLIEGSEVAWCGKGPHDFRKDFTWAVRFSRQCDASVVLNWVLPEEYRRVCSTVWHKSEEGK